MKKVFLFFVTISICLVFNGCLRFQADNGEHFSDYYTSSIRTDECLSYYEIETITKNIISKSNYCSTFLARALGDYSIMNISYEYDAYNKYIVIADLKVANGKEYEYYTVHFCFRYNVTTKMYSFDHNMIFIDEYIMDDFKTAINWGKDTTEEADRESLRSFIEQKQLNEANTENENFDETQLLGLWWDTDSRRCNMTIEKIDNGTYSVKVNWSSSASENTEWKMNIKYDTQTNTYKYSNCIQQYIVVNDDGYRKTSTVYRNGSGEIYIENGYLFWNDDVEMIRNGCAFEKSEY